MKKASENSSSSLPTSEIIRETIHISGFAVPFICTYLLDRYLVSFSILVITALYTISELARSKGKNLPIFSTITLKAAANPELHQFVTAPIFFAIAITLSLLILPPSTAYATIAILTLGDGCASLFGRKFGNTPIFNKQKTIEGSIFGFAIASLGAALFITPLKALVAASAGMLAECLPLAIDDNLSIPLATTLALTIFTITT